MYSVFDSFHTLISSSPATHWVWAHLIETKHRRWTGNDDDRDIHSRDWIGDVVFGGLRSKRYECISASRHYHHHHYHYDNHHQVTSVATSNEQRQFKSLAYFIYSHNFHIMFWVWVLIAGRFGLFRYMYKCIYACLGSIRAIQFLVKKKKKEAKWWNDRPM